jgi:isopenicillin N synthase-like dioxygenase
MHIGNRPDNMETDIICPCTEPEALEGSEEAKLPFHGPNRWPAAAPAFKPACVAYMDEMETVQQK